MKNIFIPFSLFSVSEWWKEGVPAPTVYFVNDVTTNRGRQPRTEAIYKRGWLRKIGGTSQTLWRFAIKRPDAMKYENMLSILAHILACLFL